MFKYNKNKKIKKEKKKPIKDLEKKAEQLLEEIKKI